MKSLPEYAEVLWEEVKGLSLVEPKKGEGVLFITMDIKEDTDITQLMAVKHIKHIVVGIPNEATEPLNIDNVYRMLSIVAHSLVNYAIHLGGHVILKEDKLTITLKNNMVHHMVIGVLLKDGIILQ